MRLHEKRIEPSQFYIFIRGRLLSCAFNMSYKFEYTCLDLVEAMNRKQITRMTTLNCIINSSEL